MSWVTCAQLHRGRIRAQIFCILLKYIISSNSVNTNVHISQSNVYQILKCQYQHQLIKTNISVSLYYYMQLKALTVCISIIVTVWVKECLVRTCQYFEKYRFKNSIKKPALPWYWSHSLSIIILSYLLAFVQLTWQVDNGWFLAAF